MIGTLRWEYHVETVGSAWKGISDADLDQLLADFGRNGWEVFSVEQLGSSPKIRIVAKRPLGLVKPTRPRSWP